MDRDLLPSLQFLLELALTLSGSDETKFSSQFRIGPNGCHPLFNLIPSVHDHLNWAFDNDFLSAMSYHSLALHLDVTYSRPLLTLLLHFRSTVDRSEYDPSGVSQLRYELRTGYNKFGVSPSISLPWRHFSNL